MTTRSPWIGGRSRDFLRLRVDASRRAFEDAKLQRFEGDGLSRRQRLGGPVGRHVGELPEQTPGLAHEPLAGQGDRLLWVGIQQQDKPALRRQRMAGGQTKQRHAATARGAQPADRRLDIESGESAAQPVQHRHVARQIEPRRFPIGGGRAQGVDTAAEAVFAAGRHQPAAREDRGEEEAEFDPGLERARQLRFMGREPIGLAGFREGQGGRHQAQLALLFQQPVGAEIPPAGAVEDIVEAHALKRRGPAGTRTEGIGDEAARGVYAPASGDQLRPFRRRHVSGRAADEALEAQSEAAFEMAFRLGDAQGRRRAERGTDRKIGHHAKVLPPRRLGEGLECRLVIAQLWIARIAHQHPIESHSGDAREMVEPGCDGTDERREEIVDPRSRGEARRSRRRDRRLSLAAHRHLIHFHA